MDFVTNLSMTLQPYKGFIGTAATTMTMLQLLSPAVVFNVMRKNKSTMGMPFEPFLGGGILTAGNMCFSTFLQDATMFRANFIGFSIFAVYISIYFYYVDSKDKIKALKKIIIAIAIVGAMFGYTKYEDPNLVAKRFGIFLTALLYCLIATPLLHIPKVFKTKSTARLPLPMILTGTIAGSLWLTYGIILQSGFMIIQHSFGFAMNVFQLSLFAIFPRKSPNKDQDQDPKIKTKAD